MREKFKTIHFYIPSTKKFLISSLLVLYQFSKPLCLSMLNLFYSRPIFQGYLSTCFRPSRLNELTQEVKLKLFFPLDYEKRALSLTFYYFILFMIKPNQYLNNKLHQNSSQIGGYHCCYLSIFFNITVFQILFFTAFLVKRKFFRKEK